ncbi:MFS transporter [Rhizobium bangladeshense]|nr:MFS transporter [Rhizobium bangladeshense]
MRTNTKLPCRRSPSRVNLNHPWRALLPRSRVLPAPNSRDSTTSLFRRHTGLSARDLASMLPIDLKIEDYGGNEKIVHLSRKLTEDGSGPFTNESPGDLCYFKSWGKLALFYADYRWDGLIRLGRFDSSFDALLVRGEYPVRVERI